MAARSRYEANGAIPLLEVATPQVELGALQQAFHQRHSAYDDKNEGVSPSQTLGKLFKLDEDAFPIITL